MSEETIPALPYIKLLDGADPLDVLAASLGKLGSLLDGLSPEQIEHKPAPEKWNLREIIAHMADCEVVWSWRLRQTYGEENPTLKPFEQDRWAGVYKGYSMEQAHTTWSALRNWNVAFLRTLSEDDRNRPATHPELGKLTLWTIANIAAGHDLHHLHSLEHVVKGLKG